MIRVTTLAVALTLPLGAAMAQSASPTCGPETWSTSQMAYVAQPCTTPGAGGTVGATTPSVTGTNSTTMTKAEMKQGTYGYAPMPAQAVSPGPAAYAGDTCGASNAVA